MRLLGKTLALTLVATAALTSFTSVAFGADQSGEAKISGGGHSSPVAVTVAIPTFNVTVPSVLPIDIDAYMNVTVATDTTVLNNSAGPVKVSNVTFTPSTGWDAIDFDSDISNFKVGQRKIGFMLNECKTGADGALMFNRLNFSPIASKGRLPITYDSIVSPQTREVLSQAVANVVFTLDWEAANTPPVEPEIPDDAELWINGQQVIPVNGTALITATSKSGARIADWASSDSQVLGVKKEASATPHIAIIEGLKEGVVSVEVKDAAGVTATKQISVRSIILDSIEISRQPTKTSYRIGEFFDKTNMVVTAYYVDGTAINLSRYDYYADQLDAGTNEVVISYTEEGITKTASVPITVDPDENNISYWMAKDYEFNGDQSGDFRYVGKYKYVEVPLNIKNQAVHSYFHLFAQTDVKAVKTTSIQITSMSGMFANTTSETLNVSKVWTRGTSNMSCMFLGAKAQVLDLSTWDTYQNPNTDLMFLSSAATTGYAKNQADANKWNASSARPTTLRFIVKP